MLMRGFPWKGLVGGVLGEVNEQLTCFGHEI